MFANNNVVNVVRDIVPGGYVTILDILKAMTQGRFLTFMSRVFGYGDCKTTHE